MSIIPTPGELWHPAWCARKHDPNWPVHEAQVGADLEMSARRAYSVHLQHVDGDSVTSVLLMEHTPGETSCARLSLVEAGILRDLLAEALGLVGG